MGTRKKPAQREKRPAQGRTVLVIDDVMDTLLIIRELFEFEGYRVMTSQNGLDGVQLALASPPDIVVTDISLPGIDGIEVTRRLKDDPRTSAVPVVALTAFALDDYVDLAKDAGISEFVTKPCPPRQLFDVVERVLAGA